MKEDNEDIFQKLIQKSGTDKTASGFTDKVMKSIEHQEQTAAQAALRRLLVGNALESPSPLFNRNVMLGVEAAVRKAEEPIISRKVWYGIAASILMVVAYSLTFQSPQSGLASSSFFNRSDQALGHLVDHLSQIPVLYPLTIIAMCMLLLADYYFRNRVIHRI